MKKLVTEDHVKDLVFDWYKARDAFSFAVVQSGLGIHGIHDRVGCVPVVVTPEMVGKRIGLFVSVEAKRPGRRKEKARGMTPHQVEFLEATQKASGLSICCDGYEDLEGLNFLLAQLTNTP